MAYQHFAETFDFVARVGTLPGTYLGALASNYLPRPLRFCTEILLTDMDFRDGIGSSGKHHCYPGGLLQHTAEVTCLAAQMSNNSPIAITAAMFHDRNKIYEYKLEDGKVTKFPYRHKIRHVVGSWKYFDETARECNVPEDMIEEISHCILSHHGRREWGSPVEPTTPNAYILHTADMISREFGLITKE